MWLAFERGGADRLAARSHPAPSDVASDSNDTGLARSAPPYRVVFERKPLPQRGSCGQNGVAKFTQSVCSKHCTGSLSVISIRDRLSRAVGRLTRSAVDVLFPPRCVRCTVDLAASFPILLCTDCAERLTASGEASCRRCGAWRAASRGDAASCGECQSARLEFDAVMPLGPYRGALREAILTMKRPRGEPLSAAVAGLMAARRGEQIRAFEPDGVVPVPMFWRRRMWRGTNSAELLATEIGRILDVPVVPGLVARTRNTFPQKDLSSRQRFQNVRGAFRVGKGYGLRDARIVVVDDVLTTGATCNEVAKTLKKAGAASVAVVVAGRAGQG